MMLKYQKKLLNGGGVPYWMVWEEFYALEFFDFGRNPTDRLTNDIHVLKLCWTRLYHYLFHIRALIVFILLQLVHSSH